MKKIFIILILPALLSSCAGFLEEESITDLTAGLVYSTKEGLQSAVVGLHNLEREYYTIHPEGYHAFSIMLGTDISVFRTSGDPGAAFYDANLNPTSWTVNSLWQQYYRITERSSAVIKNAESVEMTEEERSQIVAQASCFRARAYFTLYRLWENIYATDQPSTTLDIVIQPSPKEEILELIRQDLEYAIDHLEYVPEQQGRYTKAVARHLRADLALWEKDYPEAERQAKAIIEESSHSLLTNIANIFGPDDLDHNEALYVMHFNLVEPGTDRKFHRFPLLFMPRYDMVNGLKASYEYGGLCWGRAYPNEYLLSLYDTADIRYKEWYQVHFRYNDPDNLPPGAQIGDTAMVNEASLFMQLHPGCRKYIDLSRDLSSLASYKDIIVYRLAESYLFAAEALMRQGKEGEALPYINALRSRAGLEDLTSLDENLLLEEHARELALEGHRWFALKRMGVLVERVRLYGGEDDKPAPRLNIEDYHVRKPIPQTEVELNNYPQNEGYESL
jgi:hypothetical protein